MNRVTPIVIKLAETKIDPQGLQKFVEQYNAVEWVNRVRGTQPNDTEFLIELAGRACYKSYGVGLNPNVTKIRQDSREYLTNVLDKGDGSILEHATVTFAFLNVSRVFTHEIVRHRAGTAISQESLRYVRPREISLWLPPDLERVSGDFQEVVEEITRDYHKLESKFDWDKMPFDDKKRVTSALRRILPDGIATNIIWTANHRTLRWVIEMRTNPSAEVEIRKVFDEVAEICIKDFPLLYADFVAKKLSDGTTQYEPKYSKV
ncbi:MAG TPA: FAD-dependent thymidylate synthase [Candidatus Acidoferrales bacterium]|nr:FAD-dependent thymidylate synthase [Candidatus Acidoferrales bacterium]